MKSSPPAPNPDAIDAATYQAFVAKKKDELLLWLRDRGWCKLADVALWLDPRVTADIAIHRHLDAGGTHDPSLPAKAGRGHALVLKDLLDELRRAKLIEVRTAKGKKKVRVTPHKDPRFTIDPEFDNLLPRAPDELKKLEERLLEEGQRDPLVVWKGQRLLVDGHTRFRLFSLLGRQCQIVEMDFPDRAAVVAWMHTTHYGRRNFSAEMKSYTRGKEYLARKQRHGGAREKASTRTQNLKTAEVVAAEYGVGKSTILSDAAFAQDLDKVAGACGDEVRQKVLSRAARWTRRDVQRLARLERADMQEVVRVALKYNKRPKMPAPDKETNEERKSVSMPVGKPVEQLRALREALGGKALARLRLALNRYFEKRERARQG